MKEFLFRYRLLVIVCSVLLTLTAIYIVVGLIYGVEAVGGAAIITYVICFFSLFFFGKKIKIRKDATYIIINQKYISGKVAYILSEYFVSNKKERDYRDSLLVEAFGKRKVNFYVNNIHLFKKQKLDLKWGAKYLIDEKNQGKMRLIDFLIRLATKDKFLSIKEVVTLRRICKYMKVHSKTFDALLAMHNYQSEEELNRQKEEAKLKQYPSGSLTRYYKILELESTASWNEVKESYRRLVKLYHPDKQKGKSKSQQFLLGARSI